MTSNNRIKLILTCTELVFTENISVEMCNIDGFNHVVINRVCSNYVCMYEFEFNLTMDSRFYVYRYVIDDLDSI
jgi:hypothetical protein